MRSKFWSKPIILGALLLLFVVSVTISWGQSATATDTVEGDVVVRIYYDEIADIDEYSSDYDVWEYNNLTEKYVLASMSRAEFNKLQKSGVRTTIENEGVAAFGEEIEPFSFNGGYRTVAELHADLTAVNNSNPTITELVDYGDSYCKTQGGCSTPGGQTIPGRDLLALRISNEAIGGDKPVLFFMANIHSREITTPELAMRFIDHLVDGYGTDADATWLVDWHEIWVIPVVNPDGHEIVELGPYYQRKNANDTNGCSTYWPPSSSTHYGIDLNRNHSFGWNTGGSSGDACNATYRGPSAASEVEVSSLQAFAASKIQDQRGSGINDPAPTDTTGIFITLHSYSELVLWPWGNTTGPAPNKAGLQAIGDKLATYNGYTSCQPSVCLYSTSGTSDDWAYGEFGVPSFTYEVGTSFMPNYSVIDSTQWPENKPSFLYAAKIARTPYMLVEGPDALNISASPAGGNNLTLSATLNDSDNGNQAIAGATYYIDTPPWAGGSPAGSFSASDGSFNSSIENAQATLNTSGLSAGQHTLFVQATDSQGNAGAFSAIFFNAGPQPTVTPTITPTPLPDGTVFLETFENGNNWTTNPNGTDNATTGQWEVGNPEQTSSGSTVLQLGTAVSGNNTLVTGRLAGSSIGTYDIDSGTTSVRSPNITLPSSGNITLSFDYYLAHLDNATSDDFLRVQVVGSSSNTVFEELGASDNDSASWQTFSTSLNAYAGQTINLVISAADAGSGSLVEAGIDDVIITADSSVPTATPPPPTATSPAPTATPAPPTPTPNPGGTVFSDDFESSTGWTTNPNGTDNATTGQWEVGNPEQTSSGSTVLQLGTAVSGNNTLVTGRLAGNSAGTYDIDGGTTSVRSQSITLPSSGNITLSFSYYMAHLSNATSDDFLRVQIEGATVTTVFEETGAGNSDSASWQTATANLNGYAGQTITILISAADASNGSLVEAGIDDLVIMVD